MPGNVRERLTAIRSVLLREESTRSVPITDAVREAFSWYGLHRRQIARTSRVSPYSPEFVWVDTGPYGLCWPANASLARLITNLVELRVPQNPHFYFRESTAIRRGDHVLDVGACEGAFALEALTRYEAAKVWCFEPAPTMARAMRLAAEANQMQGRMEIVEAAVGGEPGVVRVIEDSHDPLSSFTEPPSGAAATDHIVSQITIDQWADTVQAPRVDYIKVDAEGADLDVLKGAAGTIRKWRPRIAITTYHLPAHCQEMIAFLETLNVGYRFSVRGIVAFGNVARPVMLHAAC